MNNEPKQGIEYVRGLFTCLSEKIEDGIVEFAKETNCATADFVSAIFRYALTIVQGCYPEMKELCGNTFVEFVTKISEVQINRSEENFRDQNPYLKEDE